ncbi:MAG TPA: hypothetical protein VM370_08095 [Candidatus Thermoplasmatota archaeon]|nr:hypothetical protein [Candidatus Thermoplasmatota archaeon]
MAEIGDYFGPMEPDRMNDTGMWIWAALITVATLVASYGVAVWWQRWKDKKRAG